jgi:hypothetical protein
MERSTGRMSTTRRREEPTAHEPDSASGVLMTWDAAVPMVGDRFFMWDMAKLWGISCSFLLILIAVTGLIEGSAFTLRMALIVPAIMFVAFYLLSMAVALVVFFNKYFVQTIVTEEGITSNLVKWSSKISKAVAAGNLVVGVLKASPLAVGSGLLADAQRSTFISWEDIRKVTTFPGPRVITISNSWRPVFRLHCPTAEIYERALHLVEARVPSDGSDRK